MTNSDYHFITEWRVKSSCEEVYDILSEPADLVRWWPSVYLNVEVLQPGDEDGIGKIVKLYTKGWLPYTLRWQFRVTEAKKPEGFALEAWGDFVGHGIWKFLQDRQWVKITYEWKIQADKPLLRIFSFLIKPIFSANHRWAMEKGEESLKLEIRRRNRSEKLSEIPSPPGLTFPHNFLRK